MHKIIPSLLYFILFVVPLCMIAQNIPNIPTNVEEAHRIFLRAYQFELALKYDEALQYYQTALTFFEQSPEYPTQKLTIHWNTGNILLSQKGQYQESLVSFHKALQVAMQMNNEKAKAEIYSKLARIYNELAQNSLPQVQSEPDFKFDFGARKIVFNITGDKVIPLNETCQVVVSDPTTEEIYDLKQNGIILPGKYNFTMEAPGFQVLTFQDEVQASKEPYVITKNLTAGSRELKFKITGDYPAGEEIPSIDSITLDGQMYEEGTTFSSGQYTLEIQTRNYLPLKDKITITAGSEPMLIERMLMTKPIVFQEQINFDVPPPTYLSRHRITFAPADDPTQEKTIRPGDTFKPGHYIFKVSKEAYQPVEQNKRVWPSEDPFVLEVTLQPKDREIQVVVEYDVPPPIFLPGWTLQMKAEQAASVSSHNRVRPGVYFLEIVQPGYNCNIANQRIEIRPDNEPVIIKAKFSAQPRPLAYEIVNEEDGTKVPVTEIWVSNKVVSATDVFPVNVTLDVVYKFKQFKDVRTKIVILPGEGAVIEKASLKALVQYTVKIRRKEETLDNIRYACSFATSVDGQKFEPVQEFQVEKDPNSMTYTIWADANSKKLRFYYGYLYSERATDQLTGILPPPDTIDVPKLNAHLDRKIKEKNITSAITVLENMIKNKIHQKRLKECRDQLDILTQHIQKWEIHEDQNLQRVIEIINTLEEWKHTSSKG